MEWTRRGLLKAGMGMAAALASGCGSDSETVGAPSSPDPTGRRPNVLILLTDQERYPQHWPPGLKDQLMPSWQRLRRHGLEFHRAFTASSLCSPSRACLLTGHYSNVNKVPSLDPTQTLPPFQDLPNLASLMEEAGYEVAYKGKWHLSFPLGFGGGSPSTEVWSSDDIDQLSQRYRMNFWDPPDAGNNAFNSAGARRTLGGGTANNDGRYVGDSSVPGQTPGFGETVLAFLDRMAGQQKPFFLFVSLVNPHDIPFYPDGFDQAGYNLQDFENLGVQVPPNYNDPLDTKPGIQKALRDAYDAVSSMADPVVRQNYVNFYAHLHQVVNPHIESILDKLEALGMTEDTVIIRSADHGEMGLSHGLREKAYTAYEETLHIPLVISNPKLFPVPRETHGFYSHVDLTATLAELVGARRVGVGKSQVPVLQGQTTSVQDAVLFCYDDNFLLPVETPGSHIRALREEDWTYAVYFSADGSLIEYELYDLRTDPGQLVNLLHSPTQNIEPEWRRLHAKLTARMAETLSTPTGFTWPSKS